MNTPNSPDPLDKRIDELFASQAVEPSPEFAERVLAATTELSTERNTSRAIHQWLRFSLPIAALLAVAFILLQLLSNKSVESESPTLTTIELQEIFILEEGLTGIADLQDVDFSNTNLLDALIFFNSETQS